MQTLIDEGRITEAEARVHPHRNLILKAIDGIHDVEPDLFVLELAAGDRLLLCSDGASGVLDDGRLADILSSGSPDYAAVELVRASLEAGSSDNVTCLVADVVDADDGRTRAAAPLLVGAAAEPAPARPRGAMAAMGGLFRGHRAGDTGELEPIAGRDPRRPARRRVRDPHRPDRPRDGPLRPARRRAGSPGSAGSSPLLVVVGLVWVALAARLVVEPGPVLRRRAGRHRRRSTAASTPRSPGSRCPSPTRLSDVELDRLTDFEADQVREGIAADNLDDAEAKVENLAARQQPRDTSGVVMAQRRRQRFLMGSCTGAAGVRSCSCWSSRSRSASARTPPSASASRARSRPTSSATAAGWPRW